MKTESPSPNKRPAPKLIEIRCPFCAAAGKRALLGMVMIEDVQALGNAARSGPGWASLRNLYYCRECDVNFVYGVISADTQGEA